MFTNMKSCEEKKIVEINQITVSYGCSLPGMLGAGGWLGEGGVAGGQEEGVGVCPRHERVLVMIRIRGGERCGGMRTSRLVSSHDWGGGINRFFSPKLELWVAHKMGLVKGYASAG